MKMGNIASPWRYDLVAGLTTRPARLRHRCRTCDSDMLALRLAPILGA
jgi:hypothetical protein